MAKYLTLLLFISFRFADNGPVRPAVTSNDKLITKPVNSELISFTATIKENKILLQWIISQNEMVDRFEIEKSSDKKNFSLAALVFSSDKAATDHYKFLEKQTGKKIFYRIRIIHKDGSVKYSSSLELDPAAKPEPIEQTKINSDAFYC